MALAQFIYLMLEMVAGLIQMLYPALVFGHQRSEEPGVGQDEKVMLEQFAEQLQGWQVDQR